MELWFVRLGKVSQPSQHFYREDLANYHSIVMIGYSLSVDIRGMTSAEKRKQIEKDNKGGTPRAIAKYAGFITKFVENIQIGDYVISPFPNAGKKYRIGKFVGEIQTVGSLLNMPIFTFSENYTANRNEYLKFSNFLARKVIWLTDLFTKDKFDQDIIKKITGIRHITRGTVTNLNFSKRIPEDIVTNNSVFLKSGRP